MTVTFFYEFEVFEVISVLFCYAFTCLIIICTNQLQKYFQNTFFFNLNLCLTVVGRHFFRAANESAQCPATICNETCASQVYYTFGGRCRYWAMSNLSIGR